MPISSSFDDIMVSYFPYFKGGPMCDISINRVFNGIRSEAFKEIVLNVRKYKTTDVELSKSISLLFRLLLFAGHLRKKEIWRAAFTIIM